MGYFASLMRQSGLRHANRPVTARSYAIDVESSEVAQSPAGAGGDDISVTSSMALAPAGFESRPPVVAANFPRDAVREAVAREPAVIQVQDVLERPVQDGGDAPVSPVASEQRFKDSFPPGATVAPNYVDPMQAALKDTLPRVASAESNAAVSRPVTFADVRAWVAAGENSQEIETVKSPSPAFRGSPATPARRQASAHSSTQAATIDAASPTDNYTLEIGSIQIVVDEPPVAAAKTTAIPARAEQPATDHSWTLRSRHYLR
jgi:hypothetical protein